MEKKSVKMKFNYKYNKHIKEYNLLNDHNSNTINPIL